MKRKDIIINFRRQRRSYQEIADILGISKQRVHQILNGFYPWTKLNKKNDFYREGLICPKPNNLGLYNSSGLEKLGGRDKLKEMVRRRDNHTCQICGKKQEKGKKSLDVHHIDENKGGKNGYSYKNCKDLDRMITLCHKCHSNLKTFRNKQSKIQKKRYTTLNKKS